MPRSRQHSDEAMLSAVRELLVEGGERAVTIAAVSERSGAPSGTIYHRFGSRAGLVAQMWVTTVQRLHAEVAKVASDEEPEEETAVRIALATVDFCARNPSDAHLLTLASRQALLGSDEVPEEIAAALRDLNAPILGMLSKIAVASGKPPGDQSIIFAAISIPYVAVRQALGAGVPIETMRPLVEVSARAALGLTNADEMIRRDDD